MYCKKCGKKLQEGWKVCPTCGNKIEEFNIAEGMLLNDKIEDCMEKDEQNKQNDIKAPKKSKKKVVISTIIILLFFVFSVTVIYPGVQQYQQEKRNQAQANVVADLITALNDNKISIESEQDMDKIKKQYSSLTKSQKKLVLNYKDLEEAYTVLQNEKDKQIAQNLMKEIENINTDSLIDTDTSIQDLKEKFSTLTDAQKQLVKNSSKIDEYAEIVRSKIAQKEAQEQAKKQAEEEAARQEAEKQAAIDGAYNAVAGKSFHLKDAQRRIEFTTSGEFVYSISSFANNTCSYSFTSKYESNKDEMQYMVFVNINEVEYYFRYFTNGSINLMGDGEFDGWYESF